MITELTLVRNYSSFWNELLPGANHYIRIINDGLKESIEKPILISDIPNRRALVNNIAFAIFKKVFLQQLDRDQIELFDLQDETLKKIKNEEEDKLKNFLSNTDNVLNKSEVEIIKILSLRLINYCGKYTNAELHPKFKGCGILFESSGDVFYHNTLVEVKAGFRNFSIHDIRQLLVYGALNYADKNPRNIKYYKLYNPRMGTVWDENVETISQNLASCSSIELYNEIIKLVSNKYFSI